MQSMSWNSWNLWTFDMYISIIVLFIQYLATLVAGNCHYVRPQFSLNWYICITLFHSGISHWCMGVWVVILWFYSVKRFNNYEWKCPKNIFLSLKRLIRLYSSTWRAVIFKAKVLSYYREIFQNRIYIQYINIYIWDYTSITQIMDNCILPSTIQHVKHIFLVVEFIHVGSAIFLAK
jgi:hypothetical protein